MEEVNVDENYTASYSEDTLTITNTHAPVTTNIYVTKVWKDDTEADRPESITVNVLADGKVVELKRAYIDWMVPQTDLKVRMGIQGIALPSFTTNASQIMDDDVAAISLNYQFNENVGLTAFWARPYNDNAGYYKNSDFGGTQ